MEKNDKWLSHALSKTLRHKARDMGITQDAQGWCFIDDLINHNQFRRLKATQESIARVVATNDKKRFEIDATGKKIRCVQGHTVAVDVEMEALTEDTMPPQLLHGTDLRAWQMIKQSGGVSRMERLHIHMASDFPENGAVSGMRKQANVVLWVDGPAVLAAGIPLFRSANGAILSPGNSDGMIPLRYITKVTDRSKSLID